MTNREIIDNIKKEIESLKYKRDHIGEYSAKAIMYSALIKSTVALERLAPYILSFFIVSQAIANNKDNPFHEEIIPKESITDVNKSSSETTNYYIYDSNEVVVKGLDEYLEDALFLAPYGLIGVFGGLGIGKVKDKMFRNEINELYEDMLEKHKKMGESEKEAIEKIIKLKENNLSMLEEDDKPCLKLRKDK